MGAALTEYPIRKPLVVGSIPTSSTNNYKGFRAFCQRLVNRACYGSREMAVRQVCLAVDHH